MTEVTYYDFALINNFHDYLMNHSICQDEARVVPQAPAKPSNDDIIRNIPY